MTTAPHTSPAYVRASHAPWWEILRQRLSSRTDRALVLTHHEGTLHVLWPRPYRGSGRGTEATPESVGHASYGAPHGALHKDGPDRARAEPSTSPAPGLFGSYRSAVHVTLGERTTEQTVRLAGETASLRLEWWVHDPAQLVHSGVLYGQDPVHRDVKQRLRDLWTRYTEAAQVLGARQVLRHLAPDRAMGEYGLTYRVADVRSSEPDEELLLDPTGKVAFPAAWSANRREEYDFCTQALRDGPVSLAALWLLRHPDQVREVLDWSVSHRALLTEHAHQQDELADLLGRLSEEEQREIGKVLRDRLIALG